MLYLTMTNAIFYTFIFLCIGSVLNSDPQIACLKYYIYNIIIILSTFTPNYATFRDQKAPLQATQQLEFIIRTELGSFKHKTKKYVFPI